jgi:tRNA G18 (ribose-2'-O)-methylase SpoU
MHDESQNYPDRREYECDSEGHMMTNQTSAEAGAQSFLMQPFAPAAQSELTAASDYGALGFGFLLYGLKSPINLGIILRVAETYQFQVSILDLHGVLDNPEKLSTLTDFACGAMSRRILRRLEDASALEELRKGRRMVATGSAHHALPLPNYHFLPGDLFVLGNEYDGLPENVVVSADAVLHVPMPAALLPKERSHSPIDPTRTAPVNRNGEPNLNVAMTAGILCYTAYADWLATHGSPGRS